MEKTKCDHKGKKNVYINVRTGKGKYIMSKVSNFCGNEIFLCLKCNRLLVRRNFAPKKEVNINGED